MLFMRNPGTAVAIAAMLASLSGQALATQAEPGNIHPAAGNLNPAAGASTDAAEAPSHFALNPRLAAIPSSVVTAPPPGLRPYIPVSTDEERFDPGFTDDLELSLQTELEALIELKGS